MSTTLRVHTTAEATQLSTKLGEVAIVKTWKETKNQTRMARGVVIPMESVKAPEVPESFRALVESCLLQSAETVLQRFVENGKVEGQSELFEVPAELFTRVALTESFLTRDSAWLTKQELELGFTASATWKRITGRAEFLSNKAYRAQADLFKDTILKLTGKAVRLAPEKCELILSKLENTDLETPVGSFIAKRLQSMIAVKEVEASIDML